MEISSTPFLPVGQPQQSGSRPNETPFVKETLDENNRQRQNSPPPSPSYPTTQATNAPLPGSELDYRQLIAQARQQANNNTNAETREGEVYRVKEEPLSVRQAIGAYRENATISDEGGELLPRLDRYV